MATKKTGGNEFVWIIMAALLGYSIYRAKRNKANDPDVSIILPTNPPTEPVNPPAPSTATPPYYSKPVPSAAQPTEDPAGHIWDKLDALNQYDNPVKFAIENTQ